MTHHRGQDGPAAPRGGRRADLTDEDLRVLLRATDPAADLPETEPAWTTWKAHQTMTTTEDTADGTAARPATDVGDGRARTRRRRTGLVAGAGLVTAGIVAAVALGTSGSAVTPLTLPPDAGGGLAAMCAQLTPDLLAPRETAFEARAVSVGDGQVVLEVTRRYQGEVDDRVSVPQPAADLPPEVSPGQFSVGADYLIATDQGGQVAACGQSGPAGPELRALYEQAYGG